MPLARSARSDSFHVLTYPSRFGLQRVSASRSVRFFLCPDLSLPMPSPGSECPLAQSDSFHVLTCLSRYHLQLVCAPCSVGFFLCLDSSLPTPSSASECSLGRFPSVFSLYPPHLLQGVGSRSIWLSIFVLSVPSFLHFSEGEPFFFMCLSPMFSLLHFSVTQPLVDKLQAFNSDVLLLFFLLSS